MTRIQFLTPGLAAGILLLAAGPRGAFAAQQHHPKVGSKPLFIRCQFQHAGESLSMESDLKLSSEMSAEELDQRIELPGGRSPIRLLSYLPLGEFEQIVVPADEAVGQPAVQVSIDGPKLSYQRWMITENPLRSRMNSMIGSWQHMQVKDQTDRDELFARFKEEPLRIPLLVVSQGKGKVHELPVTEGDVHELAELGCSVRILKFYPDHGIDPVTGKPANLSEKRRNPAVLLEIRTGTRSEERWVHVRPVSHETARKELLPFTLTLDCPIEPEDPAPVFVIVTVDRKRNELWSRHQQAVTWMELKADQVVPVPGSRYSFHISRFIPAGRLVEQYQPTDNWKKGVTALQIEFTDPDGEKVTRWLALDQKQTLNTSDGPLTLLFSPRR